MPLPFRSPYRRGLSGRARVGAPAFEALTFS